MLISGCGGSSGGDDNENTAKLEEISITSLPTKLTYLVGEALDLSGIQITGYYDDDSTKSENVNSATINGFDSSTAGIKTVTITISGKSDSFPVTVNAPAATLSVSGIVKDINGNPVQGINVKYENSTSTTNSEGLYSFDNITDKNERVVLKFYANDYFDVVRSEEVLENKTEYLINAVMIAKDSPIAAEEIIDSSLGGEVALDNGSKVELAAESIVDQNGNSYTGNVNTSLAYLDPTADDFADLIPGGSLEAEREDGSETMLISYGVVKVELRDDSGNLLQLKDDEDSKAKIEVAVPDSLKDNAPDSIPLWYFDEEKGLWIEEGIAYLNDEKTMYIGYVAHFTDWNCDYPADDQAIISGYVKDPNNTPVPGVLVKLGQTSAVTDLNGYYTRRVPALVDIETSIPNFFGAKIEGPTVNLLPGEEKIVNFTVPSLQEINGLLLSSSGAPISGFVTIKWNGNSISVRAFDGIFTLTLPLDASTVDFFAFGNDGTSSSGQKDVTQLTNGKLVINLGSEVIAAGDNELYVDGVRIPFIDNFKLGIVWDESYGDEDTGLYLVCSTDTNLDPESSFENYTASGYSYYFALTSYNLGTHTINYSEEEDNGFVLWINETQNSDPEIYFPYEGDSMSITLTKVDAIGGLIEGTFSGTLSSYKFDQNTNTLIESHKSVSGKFSVPRYNPDTYYSYQNVSTQMKKFNINK